MIRFFVCADEQDGHAEAMARGWLPIAARRYVAGWEGPQADRHEIRLVRRLSDFEWTPGLTLIKSLDLDRCPTCKGSGTVGRKSACHTCNASGKNPEAVRFEALVASGQARWIEEPEEEPAKAESLEESLTVYEGA